VPSSRCFTDGNSIIVGVRPEKMTVLDLVDADKIPDHHNRIGGRVSDVSYMGVSTQYLVMTPWDQEIIVFEQNVVVGDRSEVGDEVVIHWSPRHTFGLDGAEGTNAGVDPDVLELEAVNQALAADDTEG
jgi:spermidine/putrescine transport system ATP-binding protein